MTEEPPVEQAETVEQTEILCPHCKKPFQASLMDGAAERYRGFKCPNCRLFVPAARIKT